jgi:hypothetical protein
LNKYYLSKSLKSITINANDNIILEFFSVQNRDTKSHDYLTLRWTIQVVVKGNKMELMENGKYIAKVYKDTLKDKSDWEWLINYFKQ